MYDYAIVESWFYNWGIVEMATIMIVDDAMFMRHVLKGIFAGSGHTVIAEASNGREAIHMYMMHKPDIITMDITMPDMDGITAVKEIRLHNPQAKIIMCSAMGQHKMILEAIAAGAKDFIVKPFQADRVLESITNVLGR
jgi:two-component system chemotaxis response regulator CheY